MESSIPCLPASRCKQWKVCSYCAAIRQAQIASVAEQGASLSRRVTFAVVRTAAPNDIDKARERLLRSLKSSIDGGIWTIETGRKTAGLHVNLILGSDSPIEAATIARYWSSDADILAQEIPHKDTRNIAAYISKQGGVPPPGEYSGRLYGSYGTWKRPLAVAATQTTSPIIAGLALEALLERAGIPEPPPEIEHAYFQQAQIHGKETPHARTERIRRNQEAEKQAAQANATEKAEWKYRENMRRVLAVNQGRIELEGFVFVEGFGVASVKDLERCGLRVVEGENDH